MIRNPFVNFIYWVLFNLLCFLKGYTYREPHGYYEQLSFLIGKKGLTDEELRAKWYVVNFGIWGVDYKYLFSFIYKCNA